jgi:hypothetical protein
MSELPPRLIDRDKVWALFVDHYWSTFQDDRDLILDHVNTVLMMTPDVPQQRSDSDICAACGSPRREHEPGGTRSGPMTLCGAFIPQQKTDVSNG